MAIDGLKRVYEIPMVKANVEVIRAKNEEKRKKGKKKKGMDEKENKGKKIDIRV